MTECPEKIKIHANTPSERISSSCAKGSQRVNFAHTIDYFLINGSWCTSQHCVYWVVGFLCQKYSQCLHDGKGTGLKCISVLWKSKETKFRPFSIKLKESYPKSNIFSIILGRIKFSRNLPHVDLQNTHTYFNLFRYITYFVPLK